MAFSDGQLQFAIFFLVVFVAVMAYAYRSDLKNLKSQRKNALRVLLFIILVLSVFYALVKVLAA
jgi:hypothetical membrane protein